MTDMLDRQDPTPPLGKSISRRDFLVAGAATGGLLVGASFLAPTKWAAAASGSKPAAATVQLTAWIQIAPDYSVTILVGSTEMGQGVLTGLPQIVAEELRVDWSTVTTMHAVTNTANTATVTNPYNNPLFGIQETGGSTSTAGYFLPLQQAGAAAREMLIQAAANLWGVPATACTAQSGVITLTANPAQSVTYGSVAAAAALLPVPQNPALTPQSQWTLIGTSAPRKDLPAKVTGAAVYGIDVRLPGMVYAAIAHSPSIGGTVKTVGAKPAGALAVVNLGGAVALVANSTWQAMSLLKKLPVTWTPAANAAQMSDSVIASQAAKLMTTGKAQVAEGSSAALTAYAGAAKKIDVTYNLPYVPHACMEVLNATVRVDPGGQTCEIWAPTQNQSGSISAAAATLGIDLNANPNAVTVNTTFLGGGLGRKGEIDFIVEAVRIAQTMPGVPVHLTWSREQDFGHDQYRPMARVRFRAGLDASNNVVAWVNRIVSPSILAQKGWIGTTAEDPTTSDGAAGLAYNLGQRLVDVVDHPSPVPVSFWRSVGNSINAFGVQCALDELATLAGIDPVTFQQGLLTAGLPNADGSRLLGVLQTVASMSNWSAGAPAGSAYGLAIGKAMNTYVAQVAQVSASATGGIVVDNVWCAVDCGIVVNPDIVVAQIEGGILHGLNAAMFGRSSFSKGVASPTNFDEYRMLRMSEVPVMSVSIVPSNSPSTGVGEPGVPFIAPAVANAWAKLTGKRLRSLPFA